MNPAFEYIIENGIEEESDYAYRGRDQKCAHSQSKKSYKFSGYSVVPESDED
jgi:hypothetical protein